MNQPGRRPNARILGRLLILLAASALLPGCSPHRVNRAATPLKSGAAYPMGQQPATLEAAWWTQLGNPELNAIIDRALKDNLDAYAARARISQAMASYRRSKSGLWPQMEARASFDRDLKANNRNRRDNQWQTELNLDWDMDFFRRVGNTATAREADAWARIFETENFKLELSVKVAATYFGIIEQRALLRLLDEQLETSNELLRIIEQRYKEGLISNLDVLQQQSQAADLESQIPVAKAALEDLQNILCALLGTLPSEFAITETGAQHTFPAIEAIAPLERADELLLRRPDLRVSQALLISADADTARALSERLPRLSLSADAIRVEGRTLETTVFSIGADLVQPLLDWGSRRQEWVRTKAVYAERLGKFSQDFLDAIWEVESLRQNEKNQRDVLLKLAKRRSILDQTIKQARSRYDAGLTDYLPVLTTTQQLYALEQRIIRENRRLTGMRISLHQALGGPVTPEPAQALPVR